MILLTVPGAIGAGGLAKAGEATRLSPNPPPGAEAVDDPSIVHHRQDNGPCNPHRWEVRSLNPLEGGHYNDVDVVTCKICNKVRIGCQFSASSSR